MVLAKDSDCWYKTAERTWWQARDNSQRSRSHRQGQVDPVWRDKARDKDPSMFSVSFFNCVQLAFGRNEMEGFSDLRMSLSLRESVQKNASVLLLFDTTIVSREIFVGAWFLSLLLMALGGRSGRAFRALQKTTSLCSTTKLFAQNHMLFLLDTHMHLR